MPNPIKTSADKIVEKYKSHAAYGFIMDNGSSISVPHATYCAILEVEACIELAKSTLVVHPLIDYYQSLLTELKSRIS